MILRRFKGMTMQSPRAIDRANTKITDPMLAKAGALTLLTIPTYDGSGVVVHPSVYESLDHWNGYRYWMAMTPYTNANNTLENPSILCSVDGSTWTVPTGLTNPIDAHPGARNYNSDPYLTVDSTGLMWCWWRSWRDAREHILHRTSTNGITWSAVVEEWDYDPVATGYAMMSPSVIQRKDSTWVMYAVDIRATPNRVVRSIRATNGIWSPLQAVTITGGASTTQPWHIDVHKVGAEWHMLVVDGGKGGGDLWAAVSQDGLTFVAGPNLVSRGTSLWTCPRPLRSLVLRYLKYDAGWWTCPRRMRPLLRNSVNRWSRWNAAYYKSCFVPASKDGLVGWDAWLGGAIFGEFGPSIARTFVRFDSSGVSVK